MSEQKKLFGQIGVPTSPGHHVPGHDTEVEAWEQQLPHLRERQMKVLQMIYDRRGLTDDEGQTDLKCMGHKWRFRQRRSELYALDLVQKARYPDGKIVKRASMQDSNMTVWCVTSLGLDVLKC